MSPEQNATGKAAPARPATQSATASDRRSSSRKRARRRSSGLSEIDAEIWTMQGEFANVIYLATDR